MSEYIKEFVKKPSGGTGQKDNTGANTQGTYEAFAENLLKQGIEPGSQKGQQMILDAQKQGLIKY